MEKRCVVSRRGREASKQKKQLERGGCRLYLKEQRLQIREWRDKQGLEGRLFLSRHY